MSSSSYRDFLRNRLGSGTGPAAIYHAVRNIPYGSTGERDPVKVLANNLGSCSGKHILLRDLLRETGHTAEIITIFTYFNKSTPSHAAMPADLREMIEGEPIADFHHYVRVNAGGRWLKLDATWHDPLIPYGFPVNRDWNAEGDTELASIPLHEYPPVENLAERKTELLTELSPEDRRIRERFFRRLTEWIATVSVDSHG